MVILDLSLPKVSGPEVLRRIEQARPTLPVLVLTMYPEDQYAIALLRTGASAYLCKDRPRARAARGHPPRRRRRRLLHRDHRPAVPRQPDDKDAPPHAKLTAREHQVFTLIIQGRTSSEIAAELDLTAGTCQQPPGARSKRSSGAHSLAEMVRYAYRAGLIDEGRRATGSSTLTLAVGGRT